MSSGPVLLPWVTWAPVVGSTVLASPVVTGSAVVPGEVPPPEVEPSGPVEPGVAAVVWASLS